MAPHDPLFKTLFRELFRDLLLLVAPKLAARLVPDAKVEFRDQELIPESTERKRRIVDLLAAIEVSGQEGTILVHVEIERSVKKHIDRRLWEYSIRLRGRHPEPLVSLVVFLRGGPPGVTWQFYVERTADEEVNRFRYLSLGLSRLPAEHLLARSEPLAWGLAALARPGTLGRARLKLEALRKIATASIRERHRLLLMNCVETYLPLKGREAEEYASLRRAEESPEIQAMEMTWADRIEAKGISKGRKEGADRLRRTVVRQLGQRFGEVPAPLRRRLALIRSIDALSAIADRILEVNSIEELGLGA